jgi:four helix bundle protein
LQRFTELKVWQRSHALVLEVYRLATKFPADERFGTVAQLRRLMLSLPTNIAEGSKRESRQNYARFLNIAEGSLVEAEYLVMVSRDLSYLTGEVVAPVLQVIGGDCADAAQSACKGRAAQMTCSLDARYSRH